MRRWKVVFFILWSLCFPAFVSQAQIITNEALTIVPTRGVEPLQILVRSNGEDGLFSGEILSVEPLEGSFLKFILTDEHHGTRWEERQALPPDPQRIVPFHFPALDIPERLLLSVQAYDDFGNTVGSGHRYLEPQSPNPKITVTYSDVSLVGKELHFTLLMENGESEQAYLPQIQIYKDLAHFENLQQTLYQDLIVLDPKQKLEWTHKIPFTLTPGVHEIVVDLVDPLSKEPLSASFSQKIYHVGEYFRIMDLQAYYASEDKSRAHLDVSGLATVLLSEPVQMKIVLQHQRNIFLDKTVNLSLEPGYFTKTLVLELPDYVPELSGRATFSFKGQHSQTVEFGSKAVVPSAPIEEAVSPESEAEDSSPDVAPKKVKAGASILTFNDEYLWLVVLGCAGIALFLGLLYYARNRWFVWAFVLLGSTSLIGSAWALTIGRSVFPTVEWSYPIPKKDMLFNPSSQEGFQYLPVKGRLFNYLTQTTLLNTDEFSRLRINLLSPTGDDYQYELQPEILREGTELVVNTGTGDYYFVLDLSKLTEQLPVEADEPLRWQPGRWQLQLIFPLQQEGRTLWLATKVEDFGYFRIDEQPPLWRWQLRNAEGKALGETSFTNQGIRVVMQCKDQHTDCETTDYEFVVRGNFCEDGTRCNTQAVRELKLCDQVGNCTVQELTIQGYDPVPPAIEYFTLDEGAVFVANEDYDMSLRYQDPSQVDSAEWQAVFDDELCGEDNPFFRFNPETNLCEERYRTCVIESELSVWRGRSTNGVCEPLCPEGYHFKNGSCHSVCGQDSFVEGQLCLPFNLASDA